jgi:hypothetical protein
MRCYPCLKGASIIGRMATMIPDLASLAPSNAEEKVYEALRALPDDYRVYHSVAYRLVDAGPAREGEIDFLVLHPDRGLLAIEVKGGRIAYDGRSRVWTSTNAKGTEHRIQDPFHQAQDQVKDIVREIERRKPWGDSVPAFVHGHAVAFPDCDYRPAHEPIEAPRELVIDAGDFAANLQQRIEKIYSVWARPGCGPLGKRRVKQLGQQILAPHFKLGVSLATRIAWDEKALCRLSEEQLICLDFLDLNRRCHVQGGAGTGKTVVACEFARRLADRGASVLLLCFNLPLAHRLREIARSYEELAGSIWAGAYHELCRDWSARAGVQLRDQAEVPDGEVDFYWNEETSVVLLDAAARVAERFDALVVDEAQDFFSDWWKPLECLLRDPADAPIALFSDPAQDLFNRETRIPWTMPVFPLRTNHRLTRAISSFCSRVGAVDLRQSPDVPEGEEPEVVVCSSPAEVLERVEAKIHWLRGQGVAPASIALVGRHRFENTFLVGHAVLDGLRVAPVLDDGGLPPGANLRYATPGRLKGLEADVIIACDVDPGDSPRARRSLYVMASRARHRLYVYAVGARP